MESLKIIFCLICVVAFPNLYGDAQEVTKLEELESYIRSPNYPSETNPDGKYPNNADHVWYYEGNSSSLIQFKFWDMGIETGEGDSNITCDFDYVNVTITSIGSKRFCGHHTSEEELRGTGSLRVHLVSDDSVSYKGFVASYRIIENYDPCTPSPCGNGECVVEDFLPKCNCEPGFTGEQCTEDIEECESEPCQNGGTCNETGIYNRYECICPPGFEGTHCESEEKEEPEEPEEVELATELPLIFCYQCGNRDDVPCNEKANLMNLIECPEGSRFCLRQKVTYGGNSTIRRSCSAEEVNDCLSIIEELVLNEEEEPECDAISCEIDECNGSGVNMLKWNLVIIELICSVIVLIS